MGNVALGNDNLVLSPLSSESRVPGWGNLDADLGYRVVIFLCRFTWRRQIVFQLRFDACACIRPRICFDAQVYIFRYLQSVLDSGISKLKPCKQQNAVTTIGYGVLFTLSIYPRLEGLLEPLLEHG